MKKAIILLVIIALPLILLGTIYTVKQDHTGDFTSIQEGIDAIYVIDGDTLIVYTGTYLENVVIDKNLTVASRYYTTGLTQYIDDTVIDGGDLGYVVRVPATIHSTIINGFTITNGNFGVGFSNNHSIIEHSIIVENNTGVLVNEGSYFCYPTIKYCKIYDNTIDGIKCGCLTSPLISNNQIHHNRHGIYCWGVGVEQDCSPIISNNIIYENEQSGIWGWYASITSEFNTIFSNGNSGLYLFQLCSIAVNHCTITDNQYAIEINSPPCSATFLNSIMWDNVNFTNGNQTSVISEIKCSCLPAQPYHYQGEGCIETDPFFMEDLSLTWTTLTKSPCIDTGDPESPLDPDDTIADMGAYYYPHEIKTYEFPNDDPPINGWNWLCFDILDRTIDPYNIAENMLQSIKSITILDKALFNKIESQSNDIFEINWTLGGGWVHGEHIFTSPQGYKFRTFQVCELEIPGFRCEPETTFQLIADVSPTEEKENWIGYFLKESQHVYDAFAGYLDNITKIKAQHWSVKSPWPDVPYTLNPGDMVIVWCEEDIEEFCWIDQEQREPYIIEEPQSFSYEEESDYIPIYMQLDPEDLPTEIGAIIDGECKGSTVVQDTSAQICAYILECQGDSLEFEFYYGGRSQNKVIKEYYVYDPETMQTEKTSIKLGDKKDSYYVSFKDEPASKPEPVKLEASNYPNPFNPVTTIVYSLPEDSQISISIYNIKGQKVKKLVTGTQPAGDYNVSWNGKDESGKEVTSGIYFYKLKTQKNEITRKMLLFK